MPYSDLCQANDKSERNIMRILAAVASIVIMVDPVPALAYTQEDADACTPDAFRLCQYAIPDADRVNCVPGLEQTQPQPRLQDRIQPSRHGG
jgi:hypothetical protein